MPDTMGPDVIDDMAQLLGIRPDPGSAAPTALDDVGAMAKLLGIEPEPPKP